MISKFPIFAKKHKNIVTSLAQKDKMFATMRRESPRIGDMEQRRRDPLTHWLASLRYTFDFFLDFR